MYHVHETEYLKVRPDRVTEKDVREDLLRNAVRTEQEYFVSPPGNIPVELDEKEFVDENDHQTK